MDEPLDLVAEIDRLRGELNDRSLAEPTGSRATLYTGAVIALAVLDVVAILIIFIVRPDRDNTALIGIIQLFILPLVTAFLAASIQQVHLAVNNRLSQLLLVTQKASRAEGRLAANQDARDRHDAAVAAADAKANPPA